MTRFKIVYKDQAIADHEQIHDYLDQNVLDQRDKIIAELVSSIHSPEYLPARHRARFRRKTPGLSVHALPASKYLIYYRVSEDEKLVRILTVRHTSRRPRERFP